MLKTTDTRSSNNLYYSIYIEALKLCELDHKPFNYASELLKRSHGKRKALGLHETMRLEL